MKYSLLNLYLYRSSSHYFHWLITLFFLLFLVSSKSYGSNISVSNVTLTNASVGNGNSFVFIRFDISWDFSWRLHASIQPANWDAAWVFVKYRIGSGNWQHVILNNTSNNHIAPTGSTIMPTTDGVGAFIYRDAEGSGTYNLSGVKLRWEYGNQGISDTTEVDVRVFAVEMVYVPEGSFSLGDGSTTTVRGHFRDGAINQPFTITSENAINLGGTSSGNLANNNASGMSTADDFNNTITQTLSAQFPKGFKAFYCMKFELSQQQWVDYFNTLTNTQKTNRDITGGTLNNSGKASDAIVFRNNISWSTGEATLNGGTHGSVACNYQSWVDMAAYLDWSGLRPMSELEFEKACRGAASAITNEYPWGTTGITAAAAVVNSGETTEYVSTTNANAHYGNLAGIQGPLRVGIFASSTTNRVSSGATYYGIFDMGGGFWERVVTVGNTTGRSFSGLHGDGTLSSTGFANVTDWPGTGTTGIGFKGGSWRSGADDLRVSDRAYINFIDQTRFSSFGTRGVRTAP